MTGLDNILNEINKDSDELIKRIISEAEAEAEKITLKAQEEGEKIADTIIKEAEKKAELIKNRGASSAELLGKRSVLRKRQEIISEFINSAKLKLESLEGEEYFKVLKGIIEKNAGSKNGEIVLSKADKENVSAEFKEFLKEKGLKISDSQLDEAKKGCIIDYGSIEENCTFDAMFDSLAEELSDKVMAVLFE